eukprot:g3210.t1
MSLSKRQGEAILNLLGSLSGTAWKLCEDFNIDKAEDPEALSQILKILDGSFQYDSNVEMPADFSAYFENLARKPGQTLLNFVTDHDDRLKQIEKHGVRLPTQVQGWFLLAKASLTREQRQMIMTQAASLERPKVQQAMFAILCQDYKGGGNLLRDRWNRSNSGKGRSYFAGDDESTQDSGEEDTYYEEDDAYYMNEEETMDDTWWETFDADAAYYQEDYEEPELEFDPGEYDEAYASYVDARKRFNDLKLSRGFLPVVALQDASSSSSRFFQRPFKGLGKGKKGKGKGKSATYRYDKAPAKQPDPKGRGRAALTVACMRCGSTSHKTAQCTQQATPKPSTTSSGKRQAVESVAILNDETSLVMLEDAAGHERPDCAMLDPGASSFLMGSKPLVRYVNHLQQLGYDLTQLQLHRCQRTFHFGGDHQKVSSWTVKVPVYLNGRHGLIQGFVLSGETPMLVGRPVIKALDMTIDFSQQRIRFGDDDWQDAVFGRHEEYLLDLTSTFDSEQLSWEPSFDLQLDEQLGDCGSYDEFLTEEAIYQVDDHLTPEFTVPLTTKHWKTLAMQSQAQLNTLNAAVDDALREDHHAPPRALWEVYTGRARLSQVAEAIGMTVKTFGFETGWNFALLSHQRAFLALQDEEMPDEIYLSPSCDRSCPTDIAAERNTPLHCAAQNGHTTIMDRLVAAGAAVDAKTNGGETPLHRVAYHGRSKAAQRLVALRADVDAKNDYGVTPWAYAEANGKQTQMGFVLRPVQVGLLSGRTVPCDPELSRTVRELLEEAQSKFGTRIHHLVTSSGTTLKEHVTLQDAGIGYASYVTAIASVHDDEECPNATSWGQVLHVTSSAPRAEASVLAASEGPSGTEADSSQLLEKGAGYAHGSVEVSSPDPAVGCQSGELADARRSMQEEAQDEGFEYAASDLVEQPAAQPVLHNVEEFQSAPFVKKIGFDWEEGHTYLDIELDNTAICSVRDDIVMMSSKSVHQSNSLGFEVLEDYDAPALPAGMHVEQVTSDLVRRICVALGLAFSSDMAKKLTKIVRCKQVTDLRWYDIFRHRAFSTINACAKRGASQILLVGVQPKMLNSITGEELRCLDKDLQHACEKKSFDLYHLLKGLECPIDRLEEELQEWLRKDAKHQVVIASCCEDDQEAARHICKRLNDGLDVLEYVDALSPEEVMWNLSISAIKKVVTQLDQDGFGMPAEKFGQAMRMLGMSATTMKVSTPSTKPIGILTLHDLLLEDLKNSATDPYDMLRKFLSLLDGDCKGTMSVAELKRFLGVGAMASPPPSTGSMNPPCQAQQSSEPQVLQSHELPQGRAAPGQRRVESE